ncbi:MAG: DEDD exonuclease domain-containing protein [Propionibacteriaceae bacterium]|nr:DEDD exonuclease domain-containing protein [Propionibacteriaceae bacterium]
MSSPSIPLQPTFEDLGTPLSEVTFCVVDLETTGAGPEAAITEFGAVKVRGGEVLGEFQTFVNPGQHIPAMIVSLTGITDSMVADAPPIAEVLPTFLTFANGSVLVAHNARFDVGFLKRATADLGYQWPAFKVVDTVALARQALLRDEVPNVRLGTLAAYFGTEVTPNHRALDDARATVDVLHALLERVGSRQVYTFEELQEFTHYVSPERRAKRTMAADLPRKPGVYSFVADLPDAHGAIRRQVLYVGKSRSIQNRVRNYFTANETRPRMDEMVRIATGVEAIACRTELEAEVLELRMIAAHAPRYNRRSKYPQRQHWIKLTNEPYPRFSVSRTPGKDTFAFGPIRSRSTIEEILLALYEAYPIRQCGKRLAVGKPSGACALAEMGKCVAPCLCEISRDDYRDLVQCATDALGKDIRPVLSAISGKVAQLAEHERFEECAELTRRAEAFATAAHRFHRVSALSACRQITAALWVPDSWRGAGWEVHAIRHGQLVGADFTPDSAAVSQVGEDLAKYASSPAFDIDSRLVEEAERIAAWLESPGVRLLSVDGEWAWPLHAAAAEPYLSLNPG